LEEWEGEKKKGQPKKAPIKTKHCEIKKRNKMRRRDGGLITDRRGEVRIQSLVFTLFFSSLILVTEDQTLLGGCCSFLPLAWASHSLSHLFHFFFLFSFFLSFSLSCRIVLPPPDHEEATDCGGSTAGPVYIKAGAAAL
jgi:hypothetical protein